MKKIITSTRYTFALLFVFLLTGICSYAQSTDTLTSADYHVQMPKHLNPFYNGPLIYIIFGAVLVFLGGIVYRYWADNYSDAATHHHGLNHD